MRVYLLNPPFTRRFGRSARWQESPRGNTLYYPLWLAYATGVLQQDGNHVRLVDAPAWNWDREQVVEDAARFRPDLVVVDSSFTSLGNDVSVARGLKADLPQARVAMVGPPTLQLAPALLDSDGIDMVARGEYDHTLREVAQTLGEGGDLSRVKGLSYRHDSRVAHNPDRPPTTSQDLEAMPFVSPVYREHLRVRDYFLSSSLYPEVQICTGRGCPFRCTFCSWPETFTGRHYRARSPASVADELEYIQAELPEVNEVFFEDDTFTIHKDRVLGVCQELLRRRLRMVWSCNARATLDYDTMTLMKQAGCRLLVVGYESGDDGILVNVRKGVTTDQMRRFAQEARQAGLLVHGDFIIGLPGETKGTVEKTLGFIRELRPNILQVAVATPIPGTDFYEWARDKGYLLLEDLEGALDDMGYQKSIISYPELSSTEIETYVDRALKSYYLSPTYLPVALRNIVQGGGIKELRLLVAAGWGFVKYLGRRG